jgi:hypothetical protein
MAYRTIRVHADLSCHARIRVKLAAAAALAHAAQLIGVATTDVSRFVFPQGYAAMPGTIAASYFDPLLRSARRALDQFGMISGGAGVPYEKRLLCDQAEGALALMARCCELSRDEPEESLTGMSTRMPEYVMGCYGHSQFRELFPGRRQPDRPERCRAADSDGTLTLPSRGRDDRP